MSDVFDPAKRSAVMARIKSTGTKPELLIRKLPFQRLVSSSMTSFLTAHLADQYFTGS